MKHIVINARELRTSTGRYVERLLHYLQQIDHDHRYTVLLYPKDFDGWEPTNPNFTKVPCPHKEFSLDEQTGLLRQLNELKPDLVHFTMVQQPAYYKGKVVTTMQDLTTIRFRNPTKNPVVFTIKQQAYKWLNKRAANRSVALITPTEFVKQDVVNYTGVSPDKITVTLESADELPKGAEPVPGLENVRFIMYVGRPTPHKNLARLIDAFVLLRQKHPDLNLVLAGKKDAMYKIHERRVEEQGIEGVVFTDFISDAQLRWLYEHTAAYCFPSLSEGFGLPPLEAALHGAPLVCSNATCIPEVCGDAAHYFNPLDVTEMADKINDVLTDDKLRQDLIQKGRVQVAKFSWKRMAQQTLDVYKKVLAE
jgi:glycosyltransferase involved in cell wall biosynthesis